MLPRACHLESFAIAEHSAAQVSANHFSAGRESHSHHFASDYSRIAACVFGQHMVDDVARRILLECERLELALGRLMMRVRTVIFIGVVALAIFNGIYSPRSFLVFALQGIWYPAVLPAPLTAMFILSGFISTLLHFLISAIPAALFERTVSNNQIYSMLVWLGAMLVPSYNTLQHLGWF